MPHKGGRTKPWITEQQRYAYTGRPTTTRQVDTAYERTIAENVCSWLSTCVGSYAQECPHKICIKSRSPGLPDSSGRGSPPNGRGRQANQAERSGGTSFGQVVKVGAIVSSFPAVLGSRA